LFAKIVKLLFVLTGFVRAPSEPTGYSERMRQLLHSSRSSSTSFFDALENVSEAESKNEAESESENEAESESENEAESERKNIAESEAKHASESGDETPEGARCNVSSDSNDSSNISWDSPDEVLQEKTDPSFSCSKPRRSKRIKRRQVKI
jgi:cytoskeletal protein RodZ